MNSKQLAVVFSLLTLSATLTCFGDPPVTQPPTKSEIIERLSREVEELKETVKALRARLSELEYQGLPQTPKLMPEGKLPEAPESQAPEGYLRFPYNIERANFIWPQWNRQQRVR